MPFNTIEIRAYRPEDNQLLTDIWEAAARRAHPFFSNEQIAQQRQRVSDIYLPQAETWVAVIDRRPAGFIGLLDTFIGGLFVDTGIQGKGIGRALIDHALGLKGELTLDVYALNTQARGFYAAMGFHEIVRRPMDDEGLPFEVIKLHRRR